MLETLFIWGLVILPLAVALVLVAYRARYFVLGIAIIVLVMMLIWGILRLAVVWSGDPIPQTTEARLDSFRHAGVQRDPALTGREV